MNNPTITSNSLVLLLWNANGLTDRHSELDILLHDKRIDLALITETHFTSRSNFYIRDYKTYRTDHPDNTAHGGSAIIIHKNISHYILPSNPTDAIQATSINVTFTNQNYTVSSVYCPPNKAISRQDFLSLFQSFGPKFLAGGDFNAKHPQWGCRAGNPRGSTLLNALSSTNLDVLAPRQNTYWPSDPNRLPDLLDYFICSPIPQFNPSTYALPDLSSDHSPVVLILNTIPSQVSTRPSLINGHIDWDNFKEQLELKLNLNISLKTPQDIDSAVQTLTQAIQTSIWDSTTPYKTKTIPHRRIPLKLRTLITEKRRARAKWHHTQYPSDKRNYNMYKRQLNKELKAYKNDYFQHFTDKLSTKDRSLWDATRLTLRQKYVPSPLRKPDNTWAKSDAEKAELFSKHLTDLFTCNNNLQNREHTDKIKKDLDSPLPLSPPPKAFNPSDIKYTIKNLPLNKSPGYDLITSEILKHLPKKGILFLTYIYNSVLRTTYFPVQWKFSIVKMIPKPGKPSHSPSSYRPISLLSVMGKVLEKLLLRRITPTIKSLNLLPNHQFGFRTHHSTIQQCHRVVDVIASSLERKQYCSAVFLDEAQAFDRVWHAGLLWKLKGVLSFTYYLILKSYLSHRFFQISQGSSLSDICPVNAGVPQGSILGPLLYSLYTSDLPIHPSTVIASYADDKCILSSHDNPTTASDYIQEHLHLMEPWLKNWRIRVNEEKSVHVTFALRTQTCPQVFINRVPIPQTSSVRYLGLTLDRRLTWGPHLKSKRQETRRRYKLLLRLLDTRSKLTIDSKLLIYNSILKPTWTYGIELWGSTKKSNSNRIQSLQSIILRKITNSPFYVTNLTLHNDLKVPFVRDLAISRYQKFHESLSLHANPLVQELSSLTIPTNPPRRLKRHWPRDMLVSDID